MSATLTPEEIAELRQAEEAARARATADALDATPLLPSLGRIVTARVARPVDGLFSWSCRCGASYRSPRNLGACASCREREIAESRRQRAARIRAEVMAPAGDAFARLALDGDALVRRVSPRVLDAVNAARALTPNAADTTFPRMLLLGGTGAGKTSVATAVFGWHLDAALREVEAGGEHADHGEAFARGMLWVSSLALARARREARLGAEPELVRRARTATVLLLDDLGQEPPSEQTDVVAILMERHQQDARTIVTCGFPLTAEAGPSVESRYGAHIVRRLAERAHVFSLPTRRPS